jgi:hypothetical protein
VTKKRRSDDEKNCERKWKRKCERKCERKRNEDARGKECGDDAKLSMLKKDGESVWSLHRRETEDE